MKRSEMIESITQRLEEMVLEHEIDEFGFKTCGEWLLDLVENEGMLPPMCSNRYKTHPDFALDRQVWDEQLEKIKELEA